MIQVLIILHVLAAMLWLGGMFFALFVLRPSANRVLPPNHKLPLWSETLTHFFRWVWLAVLVLWGSGVMLTMHFVNAGVPPYIHVMLGLAAIMTLVFALLFFFPFRFLKKRVTEQLWNEAGNALNQIRLGVLTNLTLGVLTVIAALGKWPI